MEREIAKTQLEPEFEIGRNALEKQNILIEHHVPLPHDDPYHFHPSIEVNYLSGCDMTYSFSGDEVFVERGRLCVFWAAYPHRTIKVSDPGLITNAQIVLSEFLKWPMPAEFRNVLLGGGVIAGSTKLVSDRALSTRWAEEMADQTPGRQKLHSLEVQSRLYRLALEGWDILLAPKSAPPQKILDGNAVEQFEKMLLFIGHHFRSQISVKDVAQAGGISIDYAILLFKSTLGQTIKQHITDVRVEHAKMLLSETDRRILTVAMDCGFGSLSAFYDAFQSRTKTSPVAFRNGAST